MTRVLLAANNLDSLGMRVRMRRMGLPMRRAYQADVLCVPPGRPGKRWKLATLEWVAWFNHHRLLEPIGYIPPVEAEANYYRQLAGNSVEVT